ncbi:MAG: efflux RND transporter periplasmic adaptor subunit [Hydrogenovibrio sp.]|uniref:efflux RND transporter periplasmic adaptor subunit n=1 Tax=Hydrogenovibrio sp. TaxID=2065821 RepID=UPI0028701A61|nr:efflux RND transporter periplasmic adaptor subunit [Hydrogenovibrio sp.]MDR9498447.1 efflux RND transporter periplasmic adaptor subunit [Hydrogenovibrio sp.]
MNRRQFIQGLAGCLLVPQAFANTRYVCPMHPQIVRDHPGTCPICGMDLVEKQLEQTQSKPVVGSSSSSSETMAARQSFSVRTQKVERTTLWKYIETFGRVQPDETRLRHIHPLTAGWVYDLQVRADGDRVEKGQPLFWIYSTELVAAQQDYLLALRRQSSGTSGQPASGSSLVRSAKSRLRHLGMAEKTVQTLAQKGELIQRVPFFAPQSGVIKNLRIQEGMYIRPQNELFQIVDLSEIWVEADVLPLHQAWLKTGLTVEVNTKAFPEATWEGRIDYIEPDLDPVTLAKKVRIALPNAEGRLSPNMATDVVIYGGPKHQVLAVPLAAVIDDGREKRVVTRLESGGFQVQTVTTGMQTRGMVEILSGLAQGDEVVVSGQFLIDSESRIQSNLNRFQSSDDSDSSDDFDSPPQTESEQKDSGEVQHDH